VRYVFSPLAEKFLFLVPDKNAKFQAIAVPVVCPKGLKSYNYQKYVYKSEDWTAATTTISKISDCAFWLRKEKDYRTRAFYIHLFSKFKSTDIIGLAEPEKILHKATFGQKYKYLSGGLMEGADS
jgi:hypothetical protein